MFIRFVGRWIEWSCRECGHVLHALKMPKGGVCSRCREEKGHA